MGPLEPDPVGPQWQEELLRSSLTTQGSRDHAGLKSAVEQNGVQDVPPGPGLEMLR